MDVMKRKVVKLRERHQSGDTREDLERKSVIFYQVSQYIKILDLDRVMIVFCRKGIFQIDDRVVLGNIIVK